MFEDCFLVSRVQLEKWLFDAIDPDLKNFIFELLSRIRAEDTHFSLASVDKSAQAVKAYEQMKLIEDIVR